MRPEVVRMLRETVKVVNSVRDIEARRHYALRFTAKLGDLLQETPGTGNYVSKVDELERFAEEVLLHNSEKPRTDSKES